MTDLAYEDDDAPRQVDLALWWRIAGHAAPYRRSAAGMAVTGVLLAGADTALPLCTGRLIDAAAAGRPASELAPWAAGYVCALLAVALAVYVFIVLAGRISTGVAYDLRRKGFGRLQELSFSFYDTRPVGWLVARLTSDCGKISGLLPWLLLDFVWGSALTVGITVAMLALHPGLALAVLVIVPPLVVISLVFQRWMLDSSRQVRRANAKLTGSFHEAIAGVRTTKALAREDDNLEEFRDLSGEMFRHSMRNALQSAVYLPLVLAFGSLGVGLALYAGGLQVGAGLSLGTLVAFMQYATLFSMPIQEMAQQFASLQSAQAAAERVQSLLDAVPDVRNEVPGAVGPSGDGPLGEVHIDEVSFAYQEGEPVLHDCSLRVQAGETVALVGPTGGGKSTLVKLLARFYDVSSGAVRFDGADVRELDLGWVQSRFGFVLQTPHLFAGSVADNIRYGRLEATDAEVRGAAELVHADGFIEALADGYDTDVGEGGGRLSSGQRQLVSLARAVLADPRIFVMDEATSSVDTETERAIQAGIEAVLQGRIAFVIAHRLSTVRSADRIVVVEGGRIVEQGSHEALIARRGAYWALARRHGPALPAA